MKWFENRVNKAQEPVVRRSIRRMGAAGPGALWLLWCYIADHGKDPDHPGRGVNADGDPFAVEDLIEVSTLNEADFETLMTIALETGEIDADAWATSRELWFPWMDRAADEFTKKKLKARGVAPDSVPSGSGGRRATVQDTTVPDTTGQDSTDGNLVLFPVPPTDDELAERLMHLWNSLTTGVPKCLALSKSRRAHIKVRLRERSIDEWAAIFSRINLSNFCHGVNDRGWKASFDWVIGQPDVALKVLEGKYDNRTGAGQPGSTGAAQGKKYAGLVTRNQGGGQ